MSVIASLLFSKAMTGFVLFWILTKLFKVFITKCKNAKLHQHHMEKAKQRRMKRDASVQSFLDSHDFPSQERRDAILSLKDLAEIRKALDDKTVSSEELTLTYIYQSATTGLELEAIADVNYEWALQEAKECDRELANGHSRGILHGIPISVKDTVILKGTVSTNGLASKCDAMFHEDGMISKLLKLNGAIPYVKTNIPQLLMIPESCNRIFGTAKNFLDPERAPGGSSGGEGALIAGRCSPAGIGADIGGSIRIPSNFSGVYGFKPSSSRTSFKGHQCCTHRYPYDSETGIVPVTGPLGRSVDDLIILQKLQISEFVFEQDAKIPPLAFDEKIVEEYAIKPKLRIGYMISDGTFQPCAGSIDAIEKSIRLLKDAGHELIALDNAFIFEMLDAYGKIIFHGGREDSRALQGETPLKQYEMLALAEMVPDWLKPVISKLFLLIGRERDSIMAVTVGNISMDSFTQG